MRSLRHARGVTLAAGGVALTVSSALTLPTHGLNIILNYNPGASDAVNPSFDSTGAMLTDIFEYVETYYQDIFEDSHTITINYWYNNLPDNLLGRHSPVSQSGGRVTESNIRIDTANASGVTRNYFFDPTPGNDSEFNMAQTLWRDLTGTQRADWYNFGAFVPDTFEVGFDGQAIAGGAAAGQTDLLSVVLHEVGHALGMSSGNNTTVAQTADGDYDFSPSFVLGATLAAETANDSGDDNANISHIESAEALMFPSIGAGRTRPSHTDLLSMASGSFYADLDIPRREFYGDSIGDGVGSWNTAAHWSGDTIPAFNDDVFVRAAQDGITMTAFLSSNGFAANLNVSEGANVDTNDHKLDIGGDVTVTDADTDIIINPDGELEADEVFIQNSAEIAMSGGELDARRVTIDDDSQIRAFSGGSATVQISSRLINNGLLTSTADSLLYFSTTTATPWDLDGTSADGRINAISGRVWFDSGAMTDGFGGEITVGSGQFFRFDAPWTVDTDGVLDLNGGSTTADRARVIGGALTMTGNSKIEAAGEVDFDNAVDLGPNVTIESVGVPTNVEFNAAADLDGTDFVLRTGARIDFDATTDLTGTSGVSTINNVNSTLDPRIEFNAQTNYTGYTLNKTGATDLIVQQNGDADFTGTNTINADTYDMDGSSGGTTLEIGPGINNGSLTLNVDSVDTSGNTFNGTLDIRGAIGNTGFLAVNLNNPAGSWTMAGSADVSGNIIAFVDVITGSEVNISGTLNVSSLVGINADADFLSNADVNFSNSNGGIALRGDSSIASGVSFNGGGRLDVQSTGSLTFFDNANLGASDLINRGVLEISANSDGTVDDFTQTNSGDWNVDLAGASSLQYDVLVAQGDIDIDGDIVLDVLGGYAPALYTTTHTVLNGIFTATLDGVFDRVLGAVQSGYGLAVLYTTQDVRVRAALLGDANLNQIVEQGDLNAVLNNWGQSNFAGGEVSWITGDLNGNGLVEQGDLNQVLNNWGSATAPDFTGFSVPEPAMGLLLLLLGVGVRPNRQLSG